MFSKGTMRDVGIDVTIKNNPEHVLAPSDLGMIRKMKLRKITAEEFKAWYVALFKERWASRNGEMRELIRLGRKEDVLLKCPCPAKHKHCHAHVAALYLNKLIEKLPPDDNG